jgi:aspartate/methionine/tyrosine aminotransferase
MMENNLKSRMDYVQSPLITVVGEMIAQNPGTISLGQGVVSYPPPKEALEEITNFLQNTQNHLYKSVVGIPSLLETIKQKLHRDNQIKITDENYIIVTAGSNMAFMNTILAITNPGDEIILQTPYYFNHEMAIKMANCTPILVETDENYQLQTELIAQAITPKTKAIVTISPNNPTGAVYSKESLQKVNSLCQEKGIYHISDEAYEYFIYDDNIHISPASFPHSTPHTISLFSLSKAYGFASWRIGYMVIPKHLVFSVKKVQDTILICPPVISQYVANGALQIGRKYCHKYLKKINKIRNCVIELLTQIEHKCVWSSPQGAFYFFLKINSDIDPFDLTKKLIYDHKVAVIPGTTFGMDKGCYLRISYGALEEETVTQGINRLIKGINNI